MNTTGQIVDSADPTKCIDTTGNYGNVYLNTCSSTSKTQQWSYDSSIKSLKTAGIDNSQINVLYNSTDVGTLVYMWDINSSSGAENKFVLAKLL